MKSRRVRSARALARIRELVSKKLVDLGWANGWKKTPEIVERCRRLGHRPSDVDVGPRHRGLENVVTCEKCGYVYRYDSSD